MRPFLDQSILWILINNLNRLEVFLSMDLCIHLDYNAL